MGRNKKRKQMGSSPLEKMSEPKSRGGLGLKDPQRLSQALVAKIYWRWIKSSKVLWARIWQGKYAKDISPQDWIHLEGDRSGSMIWKYSWKKRAMVRKSEFLGAT